MARTSRLSPEFVRLYMGFVILASGCNAVKSNSINNPASQTKKLSSEKGIVELTAPVVPSCPVLPPFQCVTYPQDSSSGRDVAVSSSVGRRFAQFRVSRSESGDTNSAWNAERRGFPRFLTTYKGHQADEIYVLSLAYCGLNYVPANAFQHIQVHMILLYRPRSTGPVE